LASPQAYDRPSINGAWQAFLSHVPTFLLVWVTTGALTFVGFAVYLTITTIGLVTGTGAADQVGSPALALGQLGQMPFTLLSSLVGVLFTAVPALHYNSGEVISVEAAFNALRRRPLRYLLAGVLFTLVQTFGFILCIFPGIVVALVMPIFVNRIFLTDQDIPAAFAGSFQTVYRSVQGRNYALTELLVWGLVFLVTVFSCGIGALLAVPVSSFYLQNAAYHKGLLS
jgi:hypothetical protein